MKHFKIKQRFLGNVLFEGNFGSLKLCLQAAVESDADLRGANLRGADLRGANLSGADLRGADLRGADLRGAYLSGADLSGVYLRGANLSGADLRGAYLSGVDLSGAYLSGAYLIDAGQDERGYRFVGIRQDGELKIHAGCRWFNLEEAKAHWVNTHTGALRIECNAKIALIEQVAKARGWFGEEAGEKGS